MARLIAAVAAVLVFIGTSPASAAAPEVLFRISDPRIVEASGIAVGRTSPGVVYVQNDSGDTNRFFALDRRTGRTDAVVTVPTADNVDWEDIAVAPDRHGRPSVFLADIGANTVSRAEIRVYGVPEPRVDGRSGRLRASDPDVWRLRYPGDASEDAEALAVAPDGTGYLVTKAFGGTSGVYRLPRRPDAGRVQTLVRIATLRFTPTGTPNPFGPIGQVTATGAALSADGRLFAVRTYADAYVWRVHDGDLAAAVRTRPGRVALPYQKQGEGIAVAGRRLLVDSEGRDQPVYAVPIPTLPTAPASSSSAPSGSASSRPASPNMGDGSPATTLYILAGGAAAIVIVPSMLFWAARRLRRRAVAKRSGWAG